MKKRNILCTFIFVCFSSYVFSQQFENYNFFVQDSDRIMISIISFKDKTTEPPAYKKDSITKLSYPLNEDVRESITKTGSASLNRTEKQKLIALLRTPKSGHALPNQYDIQLDFYKENKMVQTVTISSETKNLVVSKKDCKAYADKDGQKIDPCFFQGTVSDELKKYVVALLKKKKLWNKDQQFLEDL